LAAPKPAKLVPLYPGANTLCIQDLQRPFGILSIHDDKEEIAQEVFAKVHFSVQRFGGRSSL
jgi:DNA-directed RNA polymerase specialized sigma24 family protein